MTTQRDLDVRSRTMIDAFLTRRGLFKGAAAGSVALGMFSFQMTQEIFAEQLTGTSLYDQLGGAVGITAVINGLGANLVADPRISGFFTSLPPERLGRLKELLIEQVANASGGPVTYTGRDMRTAHAGLNIATSDFNALVEDLVKSLNSNGVPAAAQQLLLGALAPLETDIVQIAGERQVPTVPLAGSPPAAPATPAPPPAAPASPAPAGPSAPASGSPSAARDGRTLASESAATKAMFATVWGDQAAAEWVRQHNAELTAQGH